MSDSLWKKCRLAVNLDRQVEEAFTQLIHHPWQQTLKKLEEWAPAVDLYESPDAYFLVADLPGVSPDELEVHVQESQVTIRGRRSSVRWVTSGRSVHLERAHGEFSRTFTLPEPVDPHAIERNWQQGVLQLRFPKKRPTP